MFHKLAKNINLEHDTFMYYLHEEDVFNLELFCYLLLDLVNIQNFTLKIRNETLHILMYILTNIIYHYDKNDQFKIKNFFQIESHISNITTILRDIIYSISIGDKIEDDAIYQFIEELGKTTPPAVQSPF